MTRPNIVRADTIDLQDTDNPSAAEHSKPIIHDGLAPHQREQVHHVMQERTSEEHALADAWNMAGGGLTEEPSLIEQAQDDHDTTTNGTHQEGEAGEENGDADDDDMMDRISSSPSIDDGGYTPSYNHSPLTSKHNHTAVERVKWPPRTSSLTPSPRNTPTPTKGRTFNQSPLSSTPDSSPFLQTPQHLPLHVRRTGRAASPLAQHVDCSPSPFDEEPAHSPMASRYPSGNAFLSSSSKHHHSWGRYRDSLDQDLFRRQQRRGIREPDIAKLGMREEDVTGFANDEASDRSVLIHDIDPNARPIESPFRANPFPLTLENDYMDRSHSLANMADVDLQDVLLPVDDPLLDTPPSPSSSSSSWEDMCPQSDPESPERTTNDDDTDALFSALPDHDRFIDSGWGGECLRDTEEIDFEFVYALHTFVATVEGQANATKGDTMVLLDDSNSYWWLVRVVKDSSIGYLPAEHIETPTERLARLNKHRNIDLSATMLSDNSEKTRNPLKKAMRRRNAKTVQFAAPTYVEASDYEYSTEDEDQPTHEPYAAVLENDDSQQNGEQIQEEPATEKAVMHEPGLSRNSSSSSRASFDREQAATAAAALKDVNSDEPQLSPKLVDKTEAAPLKRRKHTDSFLKDDSIETRKITLTPGLLREEGKNSLSSDSTRNPSLENLVKQVSPPDSLVKKDSKREKEKKKGGMLSGLFKSKKKDKKLKEEISAPQDLSDAEKGSYEGQRVSPQTSSPAESGRASPITEALSTDTRRQEVQTRQPTRGKLQKVPPETSQTSSPSREISAPEVVQQQQQRPEEQQPSQYMAELPGSEAAVEMAAPDIAAAEDQTHLHTELALQDKQQKDAMRSPIANMLKRDESQKAVKAKRAKERMELDDFDSPADDERPNPFQEQEERAAAAKGNPAGESSDDLSESPVEISSSTFMHGTEIVHIPAPTTDDQPESPAADENDEEEEPESLTSSPSIIDHPSEPNSDTASDIQQDDDPTPTAPRSPTTTDLEDTSSIPPNDTNDPPKPSSPPVPDRGLSTDSYTTTTSSQHTPSSTAPSPSPNSSSSISPATQRPWSDSSLRAWLEDGTEVKDMMVMIYDTSDVVPVSEDHPALAGLWLEQRKGVQDMMGQLDGLLGGLMERRGVRLS